METATSQHPTPSLETADLQNSRPPADASITSPELPDTNSVESTAGTSESAASELPRIPGLKAEAQSEGDLMPIAEEFIRVERLTWWILTGVAGGGLLLAWLLTGWLIRGFFDAAQWLGLLIPLAPIAGGIAAGRYFPRKTYDSTRWRLSQHGLEIRHGIWWRHRIFIPTERIQHTDVQQGPIMRMYGLATLVINTGGTHEPSVPLGGLKLETAEDVRDKLAIRVKTSGEGDDGRH